MAGPSGVVRHQPLRDGPQLLRQRRRREPRRRRLPRLRVVVPAADAVARLDGRVGREEELRHRALGGREHDRADEAPHGRRRELPKRVRRRGLRVPLQVGADAARVQRVGEDAVAAQLVGEAHGEEDVGELGAAVGGPGAVGGVAVGEDVGHVVSADELGEVVRGGGGGDDAAGLGAAEHREEELGEEEVAEVVGAELHFHALSGEGEGARHDAGAVHEDVERLFGLDEALGKGLD
mmetsp:Transcript_14337/g.30653  ORF Transcript_14337/g.30653 Transcript_14337/m.30653 type:complete len:236 (+) Transcript_14337:53-760(+)